MNCPNCGSDNHICIARPKPDQPSAASAGSPRTLLDEMAVALEGCPISSPAVDALLKRYYSGER